jgi:hypothetical protein
MASIIRFARPRPLVRVPKKAVEREAAEARRAFFILIGSFFVTALVMCAVVVAMVSSTWTDVIVMSAFVLVFALLKIVLANALVFTMLRYDAADTTALAEAGTAAMYRPIRQPLIPKPRQPIPAKPRPLRLAPGKAHGASPRKN